MAKMLISASEDEAICDEHQKELQEMRYKRIKNECINCYTEAFDFEKCAEHNVDDVLPNSCEQCGVQTKLIKDFQIHNQT
jgi:ribosomal protein S14